MNHEFYFKRNLMKYVYECLRNIDFALIDNDVLCIPKPEVRGMNRKKEHMYTMFVQILLVLSNRQLIQSFISIKHF